MVMGGDLTWGGEHTIQYTDDGLQNCIPETYIILLTNVTQIYSIKEKGRGHEETFLQRSHTDGQNTYVKVSQHE